MFKLPRAVATASTWQSNVGKQHFTQKAINLQVYTETSCWGNATNHQTNPIQRMIGPGPGLLTPCFPWEKLPGSKAEPPAERERDRERETERKRFLPSPLVPCPHIKTQDTHLRVQALWA